MPSGRHEEVKPIVKARTRFTWTCPCGAENNEEAFTLYEAHGKGERAKGICTACGKHVEIEP